MSSSKNNVSIVEALTKANNAFTEEKGPKSKRISLSSTQISLLAPYLLDSLLEQLWQPPP